MIRVKNALTATTNFVADHKTPIIIIATAATTAVLAKKMYGKAFDAANEFIEVKGLADEFLNYIPTGNK
jgi:hypothetical protein